MRRKKLAKTAFELKIDRRRPSPPHPSFRGREGHLRMQVLSTIAKNIYVCTNLQAKT